MTGNGWFQIFLYFVVVLLVTKPMGVFLYRVFERKKTFLDFVLRPVEKLIYRTAGIDEEKEMGAASRRTLALRLIQRVRI